MKYNPRLINCNELEVGGSEVLDTKLRSLFKPFMRVENEWIDGWLSSTRLCESVCSSTPGQ
jgi:hypothetical protein